MLVLTRKTEEKIVIVTGDSDPIVITILRIQGGEKVSVGIKANPKVRIFREELLQEDIENHNQKSLVNKNSLSAKDVARSLQLEINNHSEENEPALEASKDN